MSKAVGPLYTRYLKLCGAWGVDATKPDRDFGAFLREKINKDFKEGEFSQVAVADFPKLQGEIEALERLVQDKYKPPYSSTQSTATGATLKECSDAISTASVEALKDLEDAGIVDKLKFRLDQFKFSRSNTPDEEKK
jgi:lipopolysaccharide biosynthesis regulator YciM